MPWKELRKNSSAGVFDQQGSDWTDENANLLGDIKTGFLNVFDAYDSCEQTIIEFCSYASSTLHRYIETAKNPALAARNAHIDILISILDNAIKKAARAEKQLGELSSAIIELDGQLHTLEVNLQRDYSENSPYFKKRLDQLVKKNPGGFFDREKNKQELAAKLKKELQLVLAFYQRLASGVRLAIGAFKLANSKVPIAVKAISEAKVKVVAIKTAPPPAPSPDHAPNGDALHSAELLVALCDKYSQEHAH